MQSNEVRLGNYVYNTKGKVDKVSIEALLYLQKYGGKTICQVKPIPLTEEWLKRFGFQHIGDNDYVKPINSERVIQIVYQSDIGSLVYFNDVDEYGHFDRYTLLRRDVKHVHSFQNVIFALTGEELQG